MRGPWLVWGVVWVTVLGCDRSPEPPLASSPGPRLSTLAPALTQMLVDLGLGPNVVAVGQFDDHAPDQARVVGHYYDIDTERLLASQPTHVLVMASRDGVPGSLTSLSQGVGFEVLRYDYPRSWPDVLGVVHQLGRDLDVAGAAEALTQRMSRTRSKLQALTQGVTRPRVLLVIGTSPVMASAPGQLLDELLDVAGGVNAVTDRAVGAPTFDREGLVQLAPEVVVLLLADAPPLRGGMEDERLADFRGLPIPAVERERFVLLSDPGLLLPGSRLPAVAAALMGAIHPELAERARAVVEEQP